MKKAVILILSLVLIGSLTYADISFGIWGRTELNLLAGSNVTDSDIISLWGPDWWTLGYQNHGPYMGMDLSLSNDIFGYNLSFQFQGWDIFGEAKGDDANFVGADIRQLNGTSKVIPDLLDLKIGLISEGAYNYNQPAAGDWGGKKIGDIWEVTSMMWTLKPKDMGLKAMVNYRVPLYPDLSNGWQNIGNGAPVEECIKDIDVCASYVIPQTASITAGTLGSNGSFGDPGRPIFGHVKFFMIQGLNLELAAQYNLPEDPDVNNPSLFASLAATYSVSGIGIKAAGLIFSYMAEDENVAYLNYRAGLNIDYSISDFWIAMFNIYTHENDQDVLEINPVIKHNPSGIQLGVYINYNLTNPDEGGLTWKVPLQIDFGL